MEKLTSGKLAGLKAVSDHRGVIAAAAMDQRGSLQKSLAKERGAAADAHDLEEFKTLVTSVLTKHASAILLDPEFGLPASRHRNGKGLLLAYLLYVSKPYLPQKIALGLNGFYTAVVNKYYVDELYAKLFVKPLVDGSTRILWQGVDRKVIDDTVDNAAAEARHVSDQVRHMQSGNLRSYAGWIAAGSALVIAYMVWMGVR